MCTVVGYVGKNFCRSYVMEGLERLEYRGYDSAGFVCLHPQEKRLVYTKSQGELSNLINNFKTSHIDGHLGLGHTRWSTHGIVSTENAHPHFDCNHKISIVHNGIIENYHELKKELLAHKFASDTDTETIAHLLELYLTQNKNLKDTAKKLVNKLQGAFAFACIIQDFPDVVLAVRKKSPLCIGQGDDEMFIASDLLAFAGKTNKVLFLPDESFALVKRNKIELYDFNGNALPLEFKIVDISWNVTAKTGYEHFMLKEIYEQKRIIQNTVHKLRTLNSKILEQADLSTGKIKEISNITLIGCGTSWHASKIAQFFFEKIALIPAQVHLASEFRHLNIFKQKNSLAIAISQSGETADTLEAIRMLKSFDIHTIALTNVESSTSVRESDGHVLTYAGPEISVASTKAFTSQLTVLYWLAHRIALEKKLISKQDLASVEEHLLIAAEILEATIENYKEAIIKKLAPFYAQFKQILFIGRAISYPFALESALKLKEIAYIFADCCAAGELKHGTLALIDSQTPVFLFSSLDPIVYQKLVSNAQEIKARQGHILAFAFEDQKELINLADNVFIIPKVKSLLEPIAMAGIMQFFIYQIAKELNRPIDKPRNLAKSVTVE